MGSITRGEKVLRSLVRLEMTDSSVMHKQELPFCRSCSIELDITDEGITVDFREVEILGKAMVVAEPYCPGCNTKIGAVINMSQVRGSA